MQFPPSPLDSFRLAKLARGKPPREKIKERLLEALFELRRVPRAVYSELVEESREAGLPRASSRTWPAPSIVEGLCIIFRMHFVYMLKNSYGDLYVGITENPQQRLKYHNEKRGALFTKRDSKFQIVFLEEYLTLAEARKREIQIKKWRRDKKSVLIKRYMNGLPTKI